MDRSFVVIFKTQLITKYKVISAVSLQTHGIQCSDSSHTFEIISGVAVVVMLPTNNHMKVTNPIFLTVCFDRYWSWKGCIIIAL